MDTNRRELNTIQSATEVQRPREPWPSVLAPWPLCLRSEILSLIRVYSSAGRAGGLAKADAFAVSLVSAPICVHPRLFLWCSRELSTPEVSREAKSPDQFASFVGFGAQGDDSDRERSEQHFDRIYFTGDVAVSFRVCGFVGFDAGAGRGGAGRTDSGVGEFADELT